LTRSSMESYVLMEMFREREYTCVYYLWLDFRREYHVNPNDALSHASVIRFFHNRRYTPMVIDRSNINRNEEERYLFLKDISQKEGVTLIFMDETLSNRKEYMEKYIGKEMY
jgi:hypothetical protein